jgi:hypothetical protein
MRGGGALDPAAVADQIGQNLEGLRIPCGRLLRRSAGDSQALFIHVSSRA